MNGLRRLILVVLLFTVPFQASVGATGVLCTSHAHHDHGSLAKAHTHDAAGSGIHHHDFAPVAADHESVAEPGAHGASDKCEICSECCFTAAPVPAALRIAAPPDIPLWVSSIVDQHVASRAGDALFRPPRTTPA